MTPPPQPDEIQVSKGAVIFRQGDPGREMFVVAEGRISLTIGEGGREREVALLGPGEFFGELSLLSDAPRTATAEATEDSRLLVIGKDVFKMMMWDDLEIVLRMLNILGRRLSQTNLPIQQLMQRMERIRIAADCLRRLLQASHRLPVTLEVEVLAKELRVAASEVSAALADLARSGIGAMRDGRWTVHSSDEVGKLADALCTYAEPAPE